MIKHGCLLLLSVLSFVGFAADQDVDPSTVVYPDKGLKGLVTIERLPEPEHPVLQQGAGIWEANCKVCHGGGLAGAPKITGLRFWKDRIEKGIDTLIANATLGFQASDGGSMPARGGNNNLTDEEVAAAVRFMVSNSGGFSVALDGL